LLVRVGVDLACAGRVLVRGRSLASRTLGVLLGGKLGLLGGAGARLRFLPQPGGLLAALIEPAAPSDCGERDCCHNDNGHNDDSRRSRLCSWPVSLAGHRTA
jgi:hypothetical protein